MFAQKRRILVIFSSGSVISTRGNKSILFIDSKNDFAKWFDEMPEVKLISDLEPRFISGETDTFNDGTIERVIESLDTERKRFDGCVILVRADRLIRTAVAAEFMLQGFGKPVIFTGSRRIPSTISVRDIPQIIKAGGLGLRSNLINAVQVALSKDFPITAIMFGNKLIKPTKAVIHDPQAINFFGSDDSTYAGRVDFGITLNRKIHFSSEYKVYPKLSRKVAVAGSESLPLLLGSAHAQHQFEVLLIRLRDNEILSPDTVIELRKSFKAVVAFNEHITPEQRGVIGISAMTWDAAQVKVSWAHAVTKNLDEFAELLERDVIGEKIRT